DAAAEFQQEHAKQRDPYSHATLKILQRYGLDAVPPVDLERLAHPFAGRRFANALEFRAAWRTYLENDFREALRGNCDSPLKAALDVLRDVRDTIRSAVEFGGLTAESMHREFRGEFARLCSLLAAGPPANRVEELLAIESAGF